MTRRLKITLGASIGLIIFILSTVPLVILVRFTNAISAARFDGADPRLPKIAKTASPIAAGVKKYFAIHGACPAEIKEVQAYLPADCHVWAGGTGGYANDWAYIPLPNRKGFSLWQILSHDYVIEYCWDGSVETWTFHPGDGGPDVPITPAP